MKVDSNFMKICPDGSLDNITIQDNNNLVASFANKFTELYDEIAKEFPIFNRLKQIAKANTLAK